MSNTSLILYPPRLTWDEFGKIVQISLWNLFKLSDGCLEVVIKTQGSWY